MTVESATYLGDLAPANPGDGDQILEGDNHIRLLKQVLQNTFPNLSAAVTADATELNSLDGVAANIVAILAAADYAAVRALLDTPTNAEAVLQSLLDARGQIIYRNATTAAKLAPGDQFDVLTMGLNDPAWAKPTGWIPISAKTALTGAETEVEFVPSGDAAADTDYLMHITFTPNGDALPRALVEETTYVETASAYSWRTLANTFSSADNSWIALRDNTNNVGGAASDALNDMDIEVRNLADASYQTTLKWTLHLRSEDNNPRSLIGHGERAVAAVGTNAKVYFDAGETFRGVGYYQLFKRVTTVPT